MTAEDKDAAAASSSTSPASSSPGSPISTTLSILSGSSETTSSSRPSESVKDVSEEDKAAAAELKKRANAAFGKQDFTAAADLYSQAIEKNPTDATLFANRAYARMKLEEHGYAIGDCTKAIEIDPKYVKAYYRRALCNIQALKPKLAVADFKRVIALEPRNDIARSQLDATQRLIRRVEFEKAIEMEEEQNAADRCRQSILEDGVPMDTSYSGPKLTSTPIPNSKVENLSTTREFVEGMIEWFKAGKPLPKRYVWEIILGAYDAFMKEESLVDIVLEDGMTCDVIGDIHGQYYDFLHLLSLTGLPSENHCLLMNGDLVDRGSWSVEVILTAFALKWLYPNRMFINRGNHEAKEMNRTYGFEGEAKHKHGEQSYKLFAHVFTALPLSSLISATSPPTASSNAILSPEGMKRYFVVHGGLFSRDGVTLDEIRKEPRLGRQPGHEGLMCELLWTDPQEMPGRGPSKRGVGISFGPDVTRRWCELNKVTGIFRSHEVRADGYAIEHDGLCTTVFSAPNYVDQSGNKGAFVRVNASGDCDHRQFEAVPHPPMKPMAYVQGGLASMFS